MAAQLGESTFSLAQSPFLNPFAFPWEGNPKSGLPQTDMEAATPLEDLAPFTEVFWEAVRLREGTTKTCFLLASLFSPTSKLIPPKNKKNSDKPRCCRLILGFQLPTRPTLKHRGVRAPRGRRSSEDGQPCDVGGQRHGRPCSSPGKKRGGNTSALVRIRILILT